MGTDVPRPVTVLKVLATDCEEMLPADKPVVLGGTLFLVLALWWRTALEGEVAEPHIFRVQAEAHN